MYFVSLYYVTRLACWNIWGQLHHRVFSDCLLSCVGGPRGAICKSHRGLIPIKLRNDEKYSNPHYNSLLPMSVHARDTRYTLNKEFVSYLHRVADMQFTLYTCTVSDVQTSLYSIHYCEVDQGVGTRALLQDMFAIHNSEPCGT